MFLIKLKNWKNTNTVLLRYLLVFRIENSWKIFFIKNKNYCIFRAEIILERKGNKYF